MELSKLFVPVKQADFEYPGLENVEITLCYLTREELLKLRKKATTTKMRRGRSQPEDDIDNDLFQDLYISSVVKGWKGFKFKHVAKLLPLDMGDQDPEEEMPYSEDNARILMKNSVEFDNWVTNQLDDLENFTKKTS